MFRLTRCAVAVAVCISATCVAHADDNDFSYRLSGFGTLGYAQTDTNDLLLTNPGQLKGADKSGSALLDSRIGGQIDLTFNSKFSATVQALAKQDPKGKFRPIFSLAFIRYNFTGNSYLRVGELGWPAYQVSDFRYVGYANPWVRPPVEVYALATLDTFQGADFTWSHNLAGGFLSLRALGGHADTELPSTTVNSDHLNVNQLFGAYATYEIGDLRVRGGMSTSKVTYTSIGSNGLFSVLQEIGFGATAKQLAANDSRTNFLSLGATYDHNNILVDTEYGSLVASSLIGHASGWYGTFGYRLGKVMPYVTYAGYQKTQSDTVNPVPPVGPLVPLSMGVAGILAGNGQHSASMGIRWDVYNNIAIKAQFDHVLPSERGGNFTQVAPGYDGHAVNVYSTVVDFVF